MNQYSGYRSYAQAGGGDGVARGTAHFGYLRISDMRHIGLSQGKKLIND